MSETQAPIKVTQEKLPASQVGLEIEIAPEMSQKAYEQVISKFMRSAEIPGFRKGKVPRQVVMQRLGPNRIKAAAVEELVQGTLEKAIQQEKISVLGNLQLRSSFEDLVEQFKPGESLTFSATADVPPEVSLGQYTNLHVTAKQSKFNPDQVEAILAEYQSERATLIPVENRPAQRRDVVLIDFSGRLVPSEEADEEADQEIAGGQAEDFQLELEEGRFIAGFVDGVIGMNVDETKEVPITFPDDYFQENLAGRAAVFTITLKEIKEKELPTLDDDFAQEVSEFSSLAELRSFLEERYQQEAQQKTDASKEAALLDELLKAMEVEIPETLVTNEVNYLLTQTASRLQGQGIDVNKLLTQEVIPEMRQRLQPEAITRIKRTLALAEIAKRESIQVGTEEVEERFQSLIDQFSDRKIDRARLREIVQEDLLEEKVIQWLKNHSQVDLVEDEAENASTSVISVEAETVTEAGEAEAIPPAISVEAETITEAGEDKQTSVEEAATD